MISLLRTVARRIPGLRGAYGRLDALWRTARDRYIVERHLRGRPIADVFDHIHRTNRWGDRESVSGIGSTRDATAQLRLDLAAAARELGIRTLLDIPCGDFNWMRDASLELDRYVGADIVQSLVDDNQRRHGDARRSFVRLDLTSDTLPDADAILCRDCLVHLSFADADRALDNICRSSARYLLATTFVGGVENRDIVTGSWRPIDLERAPFSLPPPLRVLDEHHSDARKRLAIWRLDDVRAVRR